MEPIIHVKKFHLDGIPLSIYELDNEEIKPIIFSFHGFNGYKDGDYFKREDALARKGFIVVGIDSILHGERRFDAYEVFSEDIKFKDFNYVIYQTAQDAKKIYEKYLKFMDRVCQDKVYAMGVSMGGAISIYLSTIMKLTKTVSIVGTGSLTSFYTYLQEKHGWVKDKYYLNNLKSVKLFDPFYQQEKISGKLFITGGAFDEVIPIHFVNALHNNLNITTKIYQTGHMPNQSQFDDAYEFLLKEEENHEE